MSEFEIIYYNQFSESGREITVQAEILDDAEKEADNRRQIGEFIVAVNHINPYVWGRQPNKGLERTQARRPQLS